MPYSTQMRNSYYAIQAVQLLFINDESTRSYQQQRNKYKVLIAEDEDLLLTMYAAKLRNDGYEVLAAKDGRKVLELARKQQPDVIVADAVMPPYGSLSVLRSIKSDHELRSIPVITLGNTDDDEEQGRSFELGTKKFFVKTKIVPAQISRAVAALLRDKANKQSI